MVEEHAPFICVHVATSLEECRRRDSKGLYRRAFAGEVSHFTGVDDPYEVPVAPELRLDTENSSVSESGARVIRALEDLGLVPMSEAGETSEIGGNQTDAGDTPRCCPMAQPGTAAARLVADSFPNPFVAVTVTCR